MAEEAPVTYVRYHKGFQALKLQWDIASCKPEPEVVVYYGATGTGKTYLCQQASPDAYFVSSYQWYDGYNGTDDVIMDEFNGQVAFERLLRMLDKYRFQVQTKGGHVVWNPRRIFITSHFHPNEWYPDKADRFPELFRRITKLHHLKRKLRADGARATEVGGNTGTPTSGVPPIFTYL